MRGQFKVSKPNKNLNDKVDLHQSSVMSDFIESTVGVVLLAMNELPSFSVSINVLVDLCKFVTCSIKQYLNGNWTIKTAMIAVNCLSCLVMQDSLNLFSSHKVGYVPSSSEIESKTLLVNTLIQLPILIQNTTINLQYETGVQNLVHKIARCLLLIATQDNSESGEQEDAAVSFFEPLISYFTRSDTCASCVYLSSPEYLRFLWLDILFYAQVDDFLDAANSIIECLSHASVSCDEQAHFLKIIYLRY